MIVYILVEVTYDYYRFQKNLGVVILPIGKSIFDSIANLLPIEKRIYPIYLYKEDDPLEKACNENGTCHYWLQSFDIITTS